MPGASPVLLASPSCDDVHARRLLQGAQGAVQKWPEGFTGFTAAIRCYDGSEAASGTVSVFADGHIVLDVAREDELAAWVRSALGAIASARTPRFFKDGDGQFPITFEPEDRHPLGLGVRVHLGGTAWRTYRIDPKRRIRQQENADPTARVTVTYDAFMRGCPGRVLPTRTQILTWNMASRAVVEVADIDDAYERREHVWLPVHRRTTLTNGHDRRELGVELRDHIILSGASQ